MSKVGYTFSIDPILGIGYTGEEWTTYVNTLVIHRIHLLCFTLTIYYNK